MCARSALCCAPGSPPTPPTPPFVPPRPSSSQNSSFTPRNNPIIRREGGVRARPRVPIITLVLRARARLLLFSERQPRASLAPEAFLCPRFLSHCFFSPTVRHGRRDGVPRDRGGCREVHVRGQGAEEGRRDQGRHPNHPAEGEELEQKEALEKTPSVSPSHRAIACSPSRR